MPTPKFTADIITVAIEGFELQKRRIDDQIAGLRAMLPGGSAGNAAATESSGRQRRSFSAAARKRMKEAQQRRWAKVRGESQGTVPKSARSKRQLSAAAK